MLNFEKIYSILVWSAFSPLNLNQNILYGEKISGQSIQILQNVRQWYIQNYYCYLRNDKYFMLKVPRQLNLKYMCQFEMPSL